MESVQFFHLHEKILAVNEEVKAKRVVFTTHTPDEAGTKSMDIFLCERMGYFYG